MIDYLSTLTLLQQEFAASLEDADPHQPVPSCGGWTVGDLAEHLGGVHVWAAAQCRGDSASASDSPADEAGSAVARYRPRAQLLQQTLHELPADQPCDTLDDQGQNGNNTVSFWHRRQTHETLIHLWDLRTAFHVPGPVAEAAVWADGIDEVVNFFYPRQVRLNRVSPLGAGVKLDAEDVQRCWVIGSPAGQPAASLTGSAEELALNLWGRVRGENLHMTGDRTAVLELRETAVTP